MNRLYKWARESCNTASKEKLKKAQFAGIKCYDLGCEAEDSIYEGGSIYTLPKRN